MIRFLIYLSSVIITENSTAGWIYVFTFYSIVPSNINDNLCQANSQRFFSLLYCWHLYIAVRRLYIYNVYVYLYKYVHVYFIACAFCLVVLAEESANHLVTILLRTHATDIRKKWKMWSRVIFLEREHVITEEYDTMSLTQLNAR